MHFTSGFDQMDSNALSVGDMVHTFRLNKRGFHFSGLFTVGKNKLGAFVQWIKIVRSADCYSYFTRDDPKSALKYAMYIFMKAIRKVMNKLVL